MGRIKKKIPNKGLRITHGESSATNHDLEHPLFSLKHINKSHCLSSCTKDEKAAFADTLHKLSKNTWRELRQMPRHGMGYEKIAASSLNTDLPAHLADQDINLIAFRFNAMAPMVGYREKSTFHVIWIDRNFTLYNH